MLWLLAGIGVVVVASIYLWGIRSRIKEEIGKRRRRPEREPVVFGESPPQPDSLLEYNFGELGRITRRSPFGGQGSGRCGDPCGRAEERGSGETRRDADSAPPRGGDAGGDAAGGRCGDGIVP